MNEPARQRPLGHPVAQDADAGALATATVADLRFLLKELDPLVGKQGARALCARSLKLADPSSQWTAAEPTDVLLARLQQDMSRRSPENARGFRAKLLRALVDLLIALIGEPLTHRLLLSAWGEPARDGTFPEKPQ